MQTWMVQLTFKQRPDSTVMALVPQERAQVDKLMGEGKIQARYVATDNSHVWLVFKGDTQAEVEADLESLPMHSLMTIQIVPVIE